MTNDVALEKSSFKHLQNFLNKEWDDDDANINCLK